MLNSAADTDLMTFDDFCALVADGRKADLIDGVIYMASPDSRRSNELTTLLTSLLEMFVTSRNLGGRVYVNRFAFQLDRWNAPEPDVAYVSQARLHLVQEGRMNGGPDVAIEIVSRDSRDRDYVQKRALYEHAGVGEYWIVDAVQRKVEFLRLDDRGQYHPVKLDKAGRFSSRLIPGLWIREAWLTEPALPNAWECLQQVLQSSE